MAEIDLGRYFSYIRSHHPGTPAFVREEWRDVTHPDVILGRYQVSSFGQIFDKAFQAYVQQHIYTGYCTIRLQRRDGYMGEFRVQYIVAYQFVPNPSPSTNIIVNHIDGVKTNNVYTNLEWVTYSDNTRHAVYTKLLSTGFDNSRVFLTNDDVHYICRCLEQCKLQADIIEGLKDKHPDVTYSQFVSAISNIRNHRTFTEISCRYSIDNKLRNSKYTTYQVHEICKMLEEGCTVNDLMRYLGFEEDKRAMLKNDISDIVRGKDFADISKRYAIKHPTDMRHQKASMFTEEQATEAAKMLVDGKDYTTVLLELFGRDFFKNTPHDEVVKYRHALRHIRNKRINNLLGEDVSPKFNDYRKCPGKRIEHRDLGNE